MSSSPRALFRNPLSGKLLSTANPNEIGPVERIKNFRALLVFRADSHHGWTGNVDPDTREAMFYTGRRIESARDVAFSIAAGHGLDVEAAIPPGFHVVCTCDRDLWCVNGDHLALIGGRS